NRIVLPIDSVTAKECSEDAPIVNATFKEGIAQGHQGLDIGPKTVELFKKSLQDGGTILWNGPLGVYEFARFAKGTKAIAQYLATLSAITIVGGGDLIAAVNQAGVADQITHVSTGGGATLEFIEHGTLPGIDVLSEKKPVQRL